LVLDPPARRRLDLPSAREPADLGVAIAAAEPRDDVELIDLDRMYL
jgi:hypothetical protein